MVAHEIGLSLKSAVSDVAPSYPVFDRVVVSSRLIQFHAKVLHNKITSANWRTKSVKSQKKSRTSK